MHTCNGLGASCSLRLSTVSSALPWSIGRNWMQAFTERQTTLSPDASPTSTVQAPQSPSAQPSLVPVRRIL